MLVIYYVSYIYDCDNKLLNMAGKQAKILSTTDVSDLLVFWAGAAVAGHLLGGLFAAFFLVDCVLER